MSYLVLCCSCVFSVLLALRSPRLGKRELILVLFVCLFDCACLVSSVSCSSRCHGRAAVFDCALPVLFSYLFCYFLYVKVKYLWMHCSFL